MNPLPANRRHFLKTSLALAAASQLSPAMAQLGGGAPIRLVVPFTPGTGIDIIARTLSPGLSKALGRPVIVDNKPGASGNIGTEHVVRAEPNGDTLLVSVNTLVMNASLYPSLPFNPVTDLEPITLTSWGQLMLVVPASSPFKTAEDLINAAKKDPGKLNYASPGVGTPHHMSMELFKNTTNTSLTHIPYRGTGPAVTDLLGAQVECMFLPIHVAQAHIQAGKLRALGIGSSKRHPVLPDVPTLKEANAGDVDVDMWYGIFAPKGMDKALVQQLNKELRVLLDSPEIKKAFTPQGMDPATSTPEAFAELVSNDAKRWAALVKAQNIQPD